MISQVVLSFGIPFALIPLILLTRRRDVMGDPRQPPCHDDRGLPWWRRMIIALNLFLLYQTFFG